MALDSDGDVVKTQRFFRPVFGGKKNAKLTCNCINRAIVIYVHIIVDWTARKMEIIYDIITVVCLQPTIRPTDMTSRYHKSSLVNGRRLRHCGQGIGIHR